MFNQREINSREDVALLVHTFYGKIRKHELLGPIFNAAIPESDWPAHLEKLTDFWETNLFGVPKFKGNPMRAHRALDQQNHNQIEQLHFGHWLQLWFQTINELFKGDRAQNAKESARRMSTGLYFGMKAGMSR